MSRFLILAVTCSVLVGAAVGEERFHRETKHVFPAGQGPALQRIAVDCEAGDGARIRKLTLMRTHASRVPSALRVRFVRIQFKLKPEGDAAPAAERAPEAEADVFGRGLPACSSPADASLSRGDWALTYDISDVVYDDFFVLPRSPDLERSCVSEIVVCAESV